MSRNIGELPQFTSKCHEPPGNKGKWLIITSHRMQVYFGFDDYDTQIDNHLLKWMASSRLSDQCPGEGVIAKETEQSTEMF